MPHLGDGDKNGTFNIKEVIKMNKDAGFKIFWEILKICLYIVLLPFILIGFFIIGFLKALMGSK